MSSRNRLSRIHGPRRQRRTFPPLMENLESRLVMSHLPSSHVAVPPILPKEILSPDGKYVPDQQSAPTSSGLTPLQLQTAYGLSTGNGSAPSVYNNNITFGTVKGNGAGQTIAVIDAYNNPSFVDSSSPNYRGSALYEFDKEFGLPDPPSFTIYNQLGQTTNLPAYSPVWGPEEALDIEWAHAMAPEAVIDVVCATSAFNPNLFIAANTAATKLGASVVSMSFGQDLEYSGSGSYEQSVDATYFAPALASNPDVTFLASTGDTGADPGDAPNYPSVSPLIVAVGGTTLNVSSGGTWLSETGWSYGSTFGEPSVAGGGGISNTFKAPTYQSGNGINLGNGFRTVPDVSSEADPATGVWVYDPYDNGTTTPWSIDGGTSLASPTWAGMIAVADQGRSVLYGLPPLNGPNQTLPALYALGSAADAPANYSTYFHDITVGNNFYPALPGYDLVTGIGSPRANNLLPALAAFGAATSAKVSIEPPKQVIQDGQFGMAIEATTSNGTLAAGFAGTATISLTGGPTGGTLGGTTTVNFVNGTAVFNDLTLSTVSNTPYTFQIVAQTGSVVLDTLTPPFSVVVNQSQTANVGVYYPLPLDSSLRGDVTSADSDTNATDDLYLVYSNPYMLSEGQLVLENTSTLQNKSIKFISNDELDGTDGTVTTTAPIIDGNQTSRVFEVLGISGTSTNLAVVFAGMVQGLVIEGGLATDDGGITVSSASAVGGAFLVDGGQVALSKVTLMNNEARGTTGAQGSVGASRTAGPGGPGHAGGNSQGGAIYLAAGSLTLTDDKITGNIAQGGAGGEGGTGGLAGSFTRGFRGRRNHFEFQEMGGAGGTGGQGGVGAGGALYVAGGAVAFSGGSMTGNSAVGGAGGDGGKGGLAGTVHFQGGTGGVGGVAGEGNGGGVYLGGGSLTLLNSAQINGNSAAGGQGGAGGTGGTGGQSIVFPSVFGPGGDGGAGGPGSIGFGGGMYILSGTVTWSTGSSLDDNTAIGGAGGSGGAIGMGAAGGHAGNSDNSTAAGFGGGLYDQGTLTLTGASIQNNNATDGGGIDIHGTLTLDNSTLLNNTASSDGGAIYSSGSLIITGGEIAQNVASSTGGATGLGGGIYSSGKATITNASLLGNDADGSGGLGGAIFSPK